MSMRSKILEMERAESRREMDYKSCLTLFQIHSVLNCSHLQQHISSLVILRTQNSKLIIMQAALVFLTVVAAASAGVLAPVPAIPATYLTRAPAFDSAVIKSDRLGGNFAYSVAENHAYAAHTPIVKQVATPVAVSYSAPAVQYAVAAPAVQYAVAAPAPVAVAAPAVVKVAAPAPVAVAAPAPVAIAAAQPVQYAALQYAPSVQYAAAPAVQYAAAPAVHYSAGPVYASGYGTYGYGPAVYANAPATYVA